VLKELIGYKMRAEDGEFGKVNDFYFDEENWMIRYAVDKTGFWLFGQQVLISPSSFGEVDWENNLIEVTLTREQIKNSPKIEADKPVSKENEIKLTNFYRWPAYWSGATGAHFMHQKAAIPAYDNIALINKRNIVLDETQEERKLRSTEEVTGYAVISNDKDVGYVEDFIVDDKTWEIRYMILDTKKILTGKHVIIAPEWINWIGWIEKRVSVDLDKKKIEGCPDFDISLPISREYEEELYEYYNCPKYWAEKND
jgi:uncharacterized protein YrrD